MPHRCVRASKPGRKKPGFDCAAALYAVQRYRSVIVLAVRETVLAECGLVRPVLFEDPKQFYDTDPTHRVDIYFEDEDTGALDVLPSECLSVVQSFLIDIPADRISLLVWISCPYQRN